MQVRYEELFANEYHSTYTLTDALDEMNRQVQGRRLTRWQYDPELGLHLLSFGSLEWILWYRDETHIKSKMSTLCIPQALKDIPDMTEQDGWIGMDVASLYITHGNPFSICISLVDALYDPDITEACELQIFAADTECAYRLRRIPYQVRFQQISVKPIPMTKGRFKRTLRDIHTGEQFVSITDADGGIRIPPVYNDVQLSSREQEIYRISLHRNTPMGESYDLFGVCDETGSERIPCIYPDLYCMANGYFLVMDFKYNWWVLSESDEVLFGPSRDGVDIYSHNREYLYYIEYNEKGGCEALGIYSIALRTKLTPADYTRIRYLGDDRFEAEHIVDMMTVERQCIDPYGQILPSAES